MTNDAPTKVKGWQWNPEDIDAIVRAVQQHGVTVSAAAKQHSVPRKTLDDRIKGRVELRTSPGPSTLLSADEKGALVGYLLYMANHGFPLTVNMAKEFAWMVALRSGSSKHFIEELGQENTGGAT